MTPSILFVCPHGVAKSVMAQAAFNHLAAQQGLALTAQAVGLEPDPAVWPSVVALLAAEGLDVAGHQPRPFAAADLQAAHTVVTLGCSLPVTASTVAVEAWDDVPLASQDLPGAWSAIRTHVTDLVRQLQQPQPAAEMRDA